VGGSVIVSGWRADKRMGRGGAGAWVETHGIGFVATDFTDWHRFGFGRRVGDSLAPAVCRGRYSWPLCRCCVVMEGVCSGGLWQGLSGCGGSGAETSHRNRLFAEARGSWVILILRATLSGDQL
jgi:hypothetical protein